MILQFVLLIQLLAFGILAGQSFYYLVCFSSVLRDLPAREYILIRQSIDRHIIKPFKITYLVGFFSCLASVCLLLAASFQWRHAWWYAAILFFLFDLLLALKGNNPINKEIAGWNAEHYPADWQVYRDRWAKIFAWRKVLAVGYFILMMIFLVSAMNG
ncbi:DUF1772 domain-containing protein [Chitinophaga horti]|uniref:DUF1772 domain-containing protein n=1 Tax=Chitinophaga horti TaxID=2920382 RepID=A0ABY6IZP1_9BACT|nr:DUF1772 domain-containing protein [Chitinophaga horti]UYQ92888.1 DUF1772 domain-containing protein [Chitinophaga horti]